MRGLALNIMLAVVWALFSGEVSTRELAVGFLLGFALQLVFPDALGTRSYVARSLGLLRFLGFFLRELTVANVQVALFALQSHPPLNPMVVAVPIRLRSDSAQTLLTAVITLMPGSVVLGFSPDRRELYLHIVGTRNTREARESIWRVEAQLLNFLPAPGEPAPGPQEVNP